MDRARFSRKVRSRWFLCYGHYAGQKFEEGDIMRNHALDGKKERLERLKKLLPSILPMEFTKLLAVMQNDMGISEKTAKNYLDILEGIEMIKLVNGSVELVER